MRPLYTLLGHLLLPLILLYLAWRCLKERDYCRGWTQRLGLAKPTTPAKAPLWLHAASVGEVRALRPLIESLQKSQPEQPLLITTTTPTGAAQVKALFADRVQHAYLPLDLPWAVRGFLRHYRPARGLLMELELWPNLLHIAAEENVPLWLINARLSARSAQRYQTIKRLLTPALGQLERIAAQTAEDAKRLRALTPNHVAIEVMGNLKFDLSIDPEALNQGQQLRQALGQARPVWIAASTREGEEDLILKAHAKVRQHHPHALLMLVPRHPQRFAEVAQRAQAAGFSLSRYTDKKPVDADTAVWLGDTLGQLQTFYACADLAFVGGSLMPLGGQNLLEPAALGKAVLIGPSDVNFAQASAQLREAGAARRVQNAEELAQAIIELFENPEKANTMGGQGQAVIAKHRGATQWLIDRLQPPHAKS